MLLIELSEFLSCNVTEMRSEKTLLSVFLWQLTRYTAICFLSINVVMKTYRMVILFIEQVDWDSDASNLGEVPSWHLSQSEVLCVCWVSTLNCCDHCIPHPFQLIIHHSSVIEFCIVTVTESSPKETMNEYNFVRFWGFSNGCDGGY